MNRRTPLRRCCLALLFGLMTSILAQAQAIAAFTVTNSASPASIQAGQTEQLTTTVTTVHNHTNWSITATVTLNGTTVASQGYTGLTLTGGGPADGKLELAAPRHRGPGYLHIYRPSL